MTEDQLDAAARRLTNQTAREIVEEAGTSYSPPEEARPLDPRCAPVCTCIPECVSILCPIHGRVGELADAILADPNIAPGFKAAVAFLYRMNKDAQHSPLGLDLDSAIAAYRAAQARPMMRVAIVITTGRDGKLIGMPSFTEYELAFQKEVGKGAVVVSIPALATE